jgi:alkyl hydroperoxide reductase subunit AhpC
VLYIGLNGSSSATNVLETLRALAEAGRELTPAQWQTKDRTSG